MMKKKIESPFRKLRMLLVLPLAAMIFYAFAVPEYQYGSDQNTLAPDGKTMNVKGQVLKADGTTPLPGTSVILRGSTMGTITDQDGNFLIKGIPADGELVFSFVGFKSKVQKVASQPMKIVMEVEKVGIDPVTVVGYGTPPPPPPVDLTKELNGPNPPMVLLDGVQITKEALSQVKPYQIESISILKDQSAIAMYGEKGKYGVVMIVTKENAGNKEVAVVGYGKQTQTKPPSTFTIREIDNANPPLYFLDGVPIDKKTMDKINPETIKSISVLKDKSATDVYGERGKNGVLLIITKANPLSDPFIDKAIEQKKKEQVFVVVEEMPEFPGGEMALRKFIAGTVKYPADAIKESIQGKVFVTFTVMFDGTVADAKIARGVHPLLDNEAIRVINLLPTWKPGKQRGQAVNVAYTIPVQFALDGDKMDKQEVVADTKVPAQRPDGVYVVVEEMPEFPGGEMALRSFIGRTIKYPADAIKDGIQGKVFVTFVVKSDGTIGDAKIARGVHPLLDNEAIRVINLLPTWKPGKQRGQAVNVSYTAPVTFSLDGGKAKQTASFVAPRTPQKGEKQVFIVVEEMPEFPGGSIALRTFIGKAIKYPTEAQKDKIQGKVFVSFVVSSQGKVEQPKIERSVNPALDAEAIRVVSSLPDWKPGKQRGQAVSVAYTIPIEFKVQ